MHTLANYLNGEMAPPQQGQYLTSINPATAEPLAQVPDSDDADVHAAVAAAKAAAESWADLPLKERAAYLNRIADGIEARLDELAKYESEDNGKPLSLARRVDIPRAVDNFRYFASALTQFHGESYDMGSQGVNYTLRRPHGVAGLISPWNLPLYLFTWKVAPALAAGNTAVAKPSEVTPLTSGLLGEICMEAGLPPGVLNIIHGTGPKVGEAIVKHADVSALSFTGSTRVGKRIAEVAAPMFKKVSLEMGGKNASVVFADADFEKAVSGVMRASFTNQGQICLCGSRVLVQKEIYEPFLAEMIKRTEALKVGDPMDAQTDIGAIVSEAQWKKDQEYLQIAKEEGGKVETGGNIPVVGGRCSNGYFLRPTIISGLGPQCRINQEEIFGPIISIMPFEGEEEALQIANGTPYGLSATVWTENLSRAHRIAAGLHTGIVWVNSWMVRDLRTPFGGMKQSGVGREGGMEALRFFTEAKNVYVHLK